MINHDEAQLTVLVVDDDDIQRVMCCETLTQAGFEVLEANDGLPALEIFQNQRVELVILDVMMIELDGFETCRRIRAFENGQHIPILMMTGLDDVESIDQAYRAGATDFVPKPINYAVLPRRVQYMHRATATAAELRESSRRLENAQRMANLGHWEWHTTSELLICSSEAERLLRLQSFSQVALSDLLTAIHEDDARNVSQSIENCMRAKQTQQNTFRVLVDDEVRFLHQEMEFFNDGQCAGIRATIQDVTELRIAEQKAHRSTYYDDVTNLPNRLLLSEELDRALYACRKNNELLALLAIDLDEFKRVNDSLGHSVGDKVLIAVSDILRASVRQQDLSSTLQKIEDGGDIVISRMGGDEFVIVLSDIRSVEDSAIVARRVQKNLNQAITIDGKEIVLSCSIGISAFPNDCDDAETLLKNAVSAMNHAKAAGRDRYQFYNSSMNARAFERLSMEANLRKALEADQLELFFQPKVDLSSKTVIGAEALIRWIHPELGVISPIEFIPVAEETGLVLPIGEWIIDSAAKTIQSWQGTALEAFNIAINVSAAQFGTLNLPQVFSKIVSNAAIPAHHIEVEITESLLMHDVNEVLEQLFLLKESGIEIWIDDFGTGYSSLSYLKQLPISGLKIDQSFVREMVSNENDRAIVNAVIGLAKNLQLGVVAEGVEERNQLDLLTEQKCDVAQGFYFSRPVPCKEFELWATEHNSPIDVVPISA